MNTTQYSIGSIFFTKPSTQVALMIGTIMLLFSLSLHRMRHLTADDPSPHVQILEPTDKAPATPVLTGLFIRNFLEFDVLKNNFVADAYVWFEFDPALLASKIIDDFFFGKATIEHKSTPYTYSINNKTFIGYNIQIRFQTNLNYKAFPIDNHRIYLTLNNAALATNHAFLNTPSNTFQVADTVYASGWSYKNKAVTSGLHISILDPQSQKKLTISRVIFAMDFMNESFKRFILITLPLFVIFFLALFTLSMNPIKQYETVVSIPAAMMSALVAYSFVIESSSPKVAYFMLSDMIFNLFLVLNLMIFLLDAICIKYLLAYRGFLVIFFHAILIISWLTLLYVWL